MSMTTNLTCTAGGSAKNRLPSSLTWLPRLVIFALLMSLWSVRGEEPEDKYIRIFNVIQQADQLNGLGQAEAALAKYQEAQTGLRGFQAAYPNVGVKMITYRLNDVGAKIATLSAKLNPAAEAEATSSGTPGAQSSAQAKAGGGTPQVKLISPGAEPRKPLRLHPKAGDKQTVEMTMKMAMDMKMGELGTPIKMPPMKMTMDITVKNVSPEGDIDYEMLMSNAEIGEDPDVLPQVSEALKNSLGSIKGLTGTGTMSSRNFSKTADLQVPEGADPQMKQVMSQMTESFSRASAPFPEEAVGPGAKWEAKMPIKSQGMTINQAATYEIVSIDGEHVATKIAITQNAANQKIENAAAPGVKVDLAKMMSTGSGQAMFDLEKLMSPAATMDMHSDVAMAMNMGGKKQPMTMKMDINLVIEGK